MTTPVGLPDQFGSLLNERALEVRNPVPVDGAERDGAVKPTSFAERVEHLVENADETMKHAEHMSTEFAEGRQNDIHGTMISLQKADITMRFVSNVRNRAIEAYREVMRMGA